MRKVLREFYDTKPVPQDIQFSFIDPGTWFAEPTKKTDAEIDDILKYDNMEIYRDLIKNYGPSNLPQSVHNVLL